MFTPSNKLYNNSAKSMDEDFLANKPTGQTMGDGPQPMEDEKIMINGSG
jgi:hypothetical protein